jgi:integrase/recombinase XerD
VKKQSITLSQAFDGFLLRKTAEGKSRYTLRNYRTSFAKLRTYLSADPSFGKVSRDQVIGFFAWLQEDYISDPASVAARPKVKLSPKSILNVHTDLSSLWTWGVEEGYVPSNFVRTIDAPDVKAPVVEPFTQGECEALVKACDQTPNWKNRAETASKRSTGDRDRAIILLLIDSGLRAQELCDIKLRDINMNSNQIKVVGKGQKPRVVPFGKRVAKALW